MDNETDEDKDVPGVRDMVLGCAWVWRVGHGTDLTISKVHLWNQVECIDSLKSCPPSTRAFLLQLEIFFSFKIN